MERSWVRFKRFWTAEEVPRWFGFSLVMVYLVGFGAVGFLGITQVRKDASTYVQSSGDYAVRCLVDRLRIEDGVEPSDAKLAGLYQSGLYDFASQIPAKTLRIVDQQRRVIASIDATECGNIAGEEVAGAFPPGAFESVDIAVKGQLAPDQFIHAPLAVDDAPTESSPTVQESQAVPTQGLVSINGGAGTPKRAYYLEARLSGEPFDTSALVDEAGTLTVILVAMGILFGLYHCLRAQLRGASRIASRLYAHRNRIEQDLAALRMTDTPDALISAWNELVDLAHGWLGAVQRKEANAELTQVLARSGGGALSTALNALPDGIIYITDEARFEYINSAAARLLGWNAEDAKKTTLHEAQAHGVGAEVLETVRTALMPTGAFDARTVVIGTGDEPSSADSAYRIWVIPLQRAHRAGECVVVIRDVSQQIRSERAREDFVTQVTHELRTPLTNIRAYTETLSSGMFDDPNIITECYNVITKETRRLSRLIEDILSVSQLEVGSIELHTDSVDLKALLSDGVRDVRSLADEKGIDVQLVLPSKLEPALGDRDKLAVVINNLLGNAIKYTPNGGNVIVGCQFTGEAVVLTFKDNGIGIDPAEHARIFEKFQRSADPCVQDETGTGIGLYTAREIVRRHGGDIELMSEKGSGSTFLVRLPHHETRASALTTPEEV